MNPEEMKKITRLKSKYRRAWPRFIEIKMQRAMAAFRHFSDIQYIFDKGIMELEIGKLARSDMLKKPGGFMEGPLLGSGCKFYDQEQRVKDHLSQPPEKERKEINLLMHTVKVIRALDKAPKDINYVGSSDGKLAISWGGFEHIAVNLNFDPYEASMVLADDLVIAFTDGTWLKRAPYYDRRIWEYCQFPLEQDDSRPFAGLLGMKLRALPFRLSKKDALYRKGR